mmetsp:Transcript_114202/g.319084  ORF Transcript_114202/g.319084 Transcript_114202/m.319084 type:complete len:246 (-) Transcript_114202:41-778(-)
MRTGTASCRALWRIGCSRSGARCPATPPRRLTPWMCGGRARSPSARCGPRGSSPRVSAGPRATSRGSASLATFRGGFSAASSRCSGTPREASRVRPAFRSGMPPSSRGKWRCTPVSATRSCWRVCPKRRASVRRPSLRPSARPGGAARPWPTSPLRRPRTATTLGATASASTASGTQCRASSGVAASPAPVGAATAVATPSTPWPRPRAAASCAASMRPASAACDAGSARRRALECRGAGACHPP